MSVLDLIKLAKNIEVTVYSRMMVKTEGPIKKEFEVVTKCRSFFDTFSDSTSVSSSHNLESFLT